MWPSVGSLVPGPDGPEHEPRPLRRGEGVGLVAGERGAGPGELEDPVRDAVLRQVGQVRAEGVGLDAVDADVEVGAVHRAHDVGPGDVEDLVAALEPGEVVQRRILRLQHRAHRAVRHQDARGERGEQRVLGRGQVDGGIEDTADRGPVRTGHRSRVVRPMRPFVDASTGRFTDSSAKADRRARRRLTA